MKNVFPPIYVFRIQNEKGNGPYRPDETSKQKLDEEDFPYEHSPELKAIDMLLREMKPTIRYNPYGSDLVTEDEFARFLDKDYISCFSSITQLVSWFPFVDEINILDSYGYKINRVEASKVITIENQAVFMPKCEIGKCSELLSADMISEDEIHLCDKISKQRIKQAMKFLNGLKPNSIFKKKYLSQKGMMNKLISIINN